ncbi:MAG: hypothetical protein IPK99_09435 [Flavobacteriales bacterium]|nr:hypothetical protein [Flavobacteriales bacterium]
MFRIATPSRWAIVLLMVISMCASVRYRLLGDDGQAWKYAINNDGKGYYEHLRMLLLDGDIHGEPWMFTPAGDSEVIKFFVGTAVVQAPFVLVAHLHTLLFAEGLEDGYSLQYQLAIVLSALVSLLLGLWFTRELLLRIGIGEIATAFTLVAITLGTGLLVQAVVHPGMSHVHSFAAVAGWLLAVRHACAQPKPSRWALAGGLLGLVIVLRPVDVLIIAGLPLATLGVVPSMPRVRPKRSGVLRARLRSPAVRPDHHLVRTVRRVDHPTLRQRGFQLGQARHCAASVQRAERTVVLLASAALGGPRNVGHR